MYVIRKPRKIHAHQFHEKIISRPRKEVIQQYTNQALSCSL